MAKADKGSKAAARTLQSKGAGYASEGPECRVFAARTGGTVFRHRLP